jgi:hypothetical protein
MNNEKLIWAGIACVVVFLLNLFFGCSSYGAGSGVDTFTDGARSAQRLEDSFESLIGTIDRASGRLDDIRVTAGAIQGDGERLEFIIGEYDREMGRLRAEIIKVRAQMGAGQADGIYTGDNLLSGDNP